MSDLLIRVSLSHLAEVDRGDAQSMLTLIGLRRYRQLAQSGVIDIWTLKEIYAASMADLHQPSYAGDDESKGVYGATAPGSKIGVPFPHGEHHPFVSAKEPSPPSPPAAQPKTKKTVPLNAAQIPRPDALSRFPFVDDGDTESFLLHQPPGPSFLELGIPLRKRMASRVFQECRAGSVGMKVSDVPRGLAMLGLTIDPELARGFAGTFSTHGISQGQWQGVVKRFALKEEMKQRAPPAPAQRQTQAPVPISASTYPRYKAASTAGFLGFSLPGPVHAPAPVGNPAFPTASRDTDRDRDRYADVEGGGLDFRGHRQPKATGIAEQFLRGSVGRHILSRPEGWYDGKGMGLDGDGDLSAEGGKTYKGGKGGEGKPWAGTISLDLSGGSEAEAEEQEEQILRALGLLARSKGAAASQPQTQGGLLDNHHSSVSLARSAWGASGAGAAANTSVSVAAVSAGAGAGAGTGAAAPGWQRSQGGMVADFGPPQVFRRVAVSGPVVPSASASAAAASRVPLAAKTEDTRRFSAVGHNMYDNYGGGPGSAQGPQGGKKPALLLSVHRRRAKLRLAQEHRQQQALREAAALVGEAVAVAPVPSSAEASSPAKSDELSRSLLSAASHQQYFDANLSLSDAGQESQDQTAEASFGYDVYDVQRERERGSAGSAGSAGAAGGGTVGRDDDSFEFTAEQTLFLGAGARP